MLTTRGPASRQKTYIAARRLLRLKSSLSFHLERQLLKSLCSQEREVGV